MRRVAFALLAALAAGLVIWLAPIKARAESRIYPYVGLRYRVQSSEAPRPRAEIGAAFSAGRFAPSLTGSVALNGRLSPGLDLALRFKL